MQTKSLFYVLICLSLCSFADLSAQQSLPGYDRARRFAPSNAEQLLFSYTLTPQYFHHSVKFWYEYKTSRGKEWYVVDPETAKKQPLFDLEALAAQISETTQSPFIAQQLPIANLKLKDDDRTFSFEIASPEKTFYFAYDYLTRKLTETEKEVVPERWANVSPDKKWVVYAKDLNLYCMSYADYEKLQANPKDSLVAETALTTDGVEHFAFGMQRNRMNTDSFPDHKRKAVQGNWSPNGRYFAATVTDQRAVGDLWVIHSTAHPRPALETYKYQLPGESGSPVVHLYVFDLDNRSRKEITTTCFKDQTLGLAAKPRDNGANSPSVWLGNNNRFFLTRVSRDMKRTDICSYTLGEDSIKTIIPERMNTYIETRPLSATDPGGELIHWSERDGWAHLYLYDATGKLKNRITQGAWHVDKIEHVDSKGRVVYFIANGKEADDTTPYYEHLYRVNFDGTGLKLLTPGDYFHLTHMDREGRFIVDNYSRVNTIPATALYNNQGMKLMTLEESDFSQLLQAGYRFPEPFRVKAADGVTDLYGLMYKPFDFDSTKVYPLINYVYPGPQQEGTYFRYIPMNPRTDRLAQAGFVVISVGHRGGHPSRSKWYHNYGYGNLRDYPLADHKAAIEQLCDRHTYLDINRVGIHGHSGGGFMSTAAMLVYPDFFKVAVSCAGNHDNNLYNRGWSEKHHGVKETSDEDGNISFSIKVPTNQELAKNLKGHLLLIHSEIDNNVHPANTLVLVNELIKAGKRFDMLIIPNQRHHFDNYNEYFYWRMVDYFSEHLRGERETGIDIKDLKLGNWFQGYQQ
ncbi:MAG: DPP IV N-terminal domain-containing protein [Tannerellaceae bacterium]|jgi:dipeptidyl aminopeptidase/acylaminoacyl peptidase|nr:DPP IV N-terminal domain-containing protein [Tannerellaceae bacterium]